MWVIGVIPNLFGIQAHMGLGTIKANHMAIYICSELMTSIKSVTNLIPE